MESEQNHKIWELRGSDFREAALETFHFQFEHNPLYQSYCRLLGVNPATISQLEQLPFLPIGFFKSQTVRTGQFEPRMRFESSGTTGMTNSRHELPDTVVYEKSFRKGFQQFYGDIKSYCILGLLPSYLERGNSSLVYMVNDWIRDSEHPLSGFYLNEWEKLHQTLCRLEEEQQPTILIGVSFALLDFAGRYPMPLRSVKLIETGGMKGRRREMQRAELHDLLKKAFSLNEIGSEYGMTELLSQAYALREGRFSTVPWMKVLLREEDDPLQVLPEGKPGRGAINIIDLANRHSCAFIATDDAGRTHADGSFEVLGRLDNSDIRGCSLLVV